MPIMGGRTGAPTSAGYVLVAEEAQGVLTAERVLHRLAAYHPDNPPDTAVDWSDDFDEPTLDPAWSWDSVPATADLTFRSVYRIETAGTGSHVLRRAWAPAGDLTVVAKLALAKITAADTPWVMVGVGDAVNDHVYASIAFRQTLGSLFALHAPPGFTTVDSATLLGDARGGLLYIYCRLRRTAGVWHASWSLNGINWFGLATTSATVMTVTHFRLRIADQPLGVGIEWIRAWSSNVAKIGS